jgi:catechol 2,3-dioxygenase-like lactoylglutathione lyase family enzyme
VITGAHVTIFAEDAEAARAFFRDVLGFPHVDAGDGWLIFATPPAEVGIHPGGGWEQGEGRHLLFLMCDDIARTVEELTQKGVEFVEPVTDEGFGLMTSLKVPGAGRLGLYQPAYELPNP